MMFTVPIIVLEFQTPASLHILASTEHWLLLWAGQRSQGEVWGGNQADFYLYNSKKEEKEETKLKEGEKRKREREGRGENKMEN